MKYNILIVLVIVFALSSLQVAASQDCNSAWQGNWYQDAWGCIKLTQTGNHVAGPFSGGAKGTFDVYADPNNPCVMTGTWSENNGNGGYLRLEMGSDGKEFSGNFDHGSGKYESSFGTAVSSLCDD